MKYNYFQITLITLNTQNDNEIVGADLAISEIQTTLLYKENMPCTNYEGKPYLHKHHQRFVNWGSINKRAYVAWLVNQGKFCAEKSMRELSE